MLKALLPFIISTLVGIYALFFALLYFLKKKGKSCPEQVKKLKLLVLVFFAVIVYCAFFDDSKTVFVCESEPKTCTYYHATIANKKLRFVRKYDLSEKESVSVEKHTDYRGRGRTRTYYKVVFTSGFDFPKEFDLTEEAEKEARKIGRFLSGERQNYRFYYERGGSDGEYLSLISLVFLTIFGTTATIVTGISLYKASKQR